MLDYGLVVTFLAILLIFIRTESMQVLDLKSWTWSKVNATFKADSSEPQNPGLGTPCADHSLVSKNPRFSFCSLSPFWGQSVTVIPFNELIACFFFF